MCFQLPGEFISDGKVSSFFFLSWLFVMSQRGIDIHCKNVLVGDLLGMVSY